jgi:PhnB protein
MSPTDTQPTRQTCTPYLCCRDAVRALEFYERAFGASIEIRYSSPEGKIGHAEMAIEGSHLYVSDEWAEADAWSPQKYGGTPVVIHLIVKDVDAFAARAVAQGAELARPVADQPYGDRSGVLQDPFGHRWLVATPLEEVSKAELRKRMGDAFLID